MAKRARITPMRSLSRPVERENLGEVRFSRTSVVCDFCTSGEVEWQFPCETFELPTPVLGVNLDHRFSSAWMACDPCRVLVEAGDLEGLVARWYASSVNVEGIRVEDHLIVRGWIRRVHRAFFEHRKGDVVRV